MGQGDIAQRWSADGQQAREKMFPSSVIREVQTSAMKGLLTPASAIRIQIPESQVARAGKKAGAQAAGSGVGSKAMQSSGAAPTPPWGWPQEKRSHVSAGHRKPCALTAVCVSRPRGQLSPANGCRERGFPSVEQYLAARRNEAQARAPMRRA